MKGGNGSKLHPLDLGSCSDYLGIVTDGRKIVVVAMLMAYSYNIRRFPDGAVG